MALLDLIDVSKSYETGKILEEISLFIGEKERIAIIGKNGGGKSTLMKIINGTLETDSGRRVIQNNIKVEMLEQNPKFEETQSVRDVIEGQLTELTKKREEYEILSQKIALDFTNKELLREQSFIAAFLDTHNAWNLDDKIERILQEFDLKIYENRAISLLSGGERRRVALAGLVLKKPDILLLDEPTNHLDVYMVSFLEEMLLKENFTLVFISHDRYFIDKIATRTVEIDNFKLRSFEGGYADYLRDKELLLHSMQKEHENLLKLLKSEEEWLRQGVRARLKRDEGRKARVFKMREEAKKNPSSIRKIRLEIDREKHNFNQDKSTNKQKMLFEIENISKALGSKTLIENFSARILQKERIAIVGKNGTGKSTLLRLLLGELKVDSGNIKKGEFETGYFDQQRNMLDDDKNILETFCPNGGDRVDVQGRNMHVFGYLKNFLFPKEYLDKKIGILSGGEKNRIALALLFAKKTDCLILDEPTNDLDIPTINIVEEYLQNYSGAVLFVSHDRYFVDKIAKKLLIFKKGGEIIESYGSYSEFLEYESEIKEIDEFEKSLNDNSSLQNIKQKTKSQKLSYKERQEYEKLPQIIEKLENEIAKLKECLANPECYQKMGITTLNDELVKKELELEPMIERYLEIEQKIDSFEQ
ncbi:MAG: ABC-F family ATP-binding cassette domain-containing protein [Campylobacteraceae bacterium]|nr:ABC-F family ATP-binding cassette domain-containing protein [Campylobacteraceae bacterium]